MGHAFQIKQNDRLPVIGAFLEKEATGDPIDFSNEASNAASSVRFLMRASGSATYILATYATIVGTTTGEVEYAWGSGETATVGYYQGEFEILWNSASKLQTVPNKTYIPIQVVDDVL